VKTPKPISDLIQNFERLPGIGPKTAQRLVFYMLRFPQEELDKFGQNIAELKTKTKICSVCKNIDQEDPCCICSDSSRDIDLIAVVTTPLDLYALERAGFKGLYHVLHGVIDPLNNIGPEEIYLKELLSRIDDISPTADAPLELLMATNTGMEGESTAIYISRAIREKGYSNDIIKITRIARGLPVGGDVEYADDLTLHRALEGRSNFDL